MNIRTKLTTMAMALTMLVGASAFIAATPEPADAAYRCAQYSRHNYCLSYRWVGGSNRGVYWS